MTQIETTQPIGTCNLINWYRNSTLLLCVLTLLQCCSDLHLWRGDCAHILVLATALVVLLTSFSPATQCRVDQNNNKRCNPMRKLDGVYRKRCANVSLVLMLIPLWYPEPITSAPTSTELWCELYWISQPLFIGLALAALIGYSIILRRPVQTIETRSNLLFRLSALLFLAHLCFAYLSGIGPWQFNLNLFIDRALPGIVFLLLALISLISRYRQPSHSRQPEIKLLLLASVVVSQLSLPLYG